MGRVIGAEIPVLAQANPRHNVSEPCPWASSGDRARKQPAMQNTSPARLYALVFGAVYIGVAIWASSSATATPYCRWQGPRLRPLPVARGRPDPPRPDLDVLD